jgi:hypothetical protein
VAVHRVPAGLAVTDGELDRAGVIPAPETGAEEGGRLRLRIVRFGGAVTGSVECPWHDRAVALRRKPLDPALAVRVEAKGASVSPDDLVVRAGSADESLFEEAPVEWSRWRGRLAVTDKWQCDPRWTFAGVFSEAVDDMTEAAGAFTTTSYLGDADLRFHFAMKDVLGGMSGGKRRYVRRDMNFAFAAGATDPASGYALLLGGFGNRGVQLMRLGKVVAESDAFRLPEFRGGESDVHWRWFTLAVSTEGGRIRASVDGREVMSWEDPEPLEGGRVGAWTVGNGIILGRTRFTAERRAGPSAPLEAAAGGSCAGWVPAFDGEGVTVRPGEAPGLVRVTNLAGGGRFAAASSREEWPDGAVLAFRAPPGVSVEARVVTRRARPAPWAGPQAEPRPLFKGEGPRLPADGEWHILPLDAPVGDHEQPVIGAFAPEGYAAAGIGANARGSWYEAGAFDSMDECVRALGAPHSPPP